MGKSLPRRPAGHAFPWPDDSLQGTNTYLYNIDVAKANYWDGRYGALSNNPAHPWFNEPSGRRRWVITTADRS
jgi:hypothetical protein